jgi:hypothetical protein
MIKPPKRSCSAGDALNSPKAASSRRQPTRDNTDLSRKNAPPIPTPRARFTPLPLTKGPEDGSLRHRATVHGLLSRRPQVGREEYRPLAQGLGDREGHGTGIPTSHARLERVEEDQFRRRVLARLHGAEEAGRTGAKGKSTGAARRRSSRGIPTFPAKTVGGASEIPTPGARNTDLRRKK